MPIMFVRAADCVVLVCSRAAPRHYQRACRLRVLAETLTFGLLMKAPGPLIQPPCAPLLTWVLQGQCTKSSCMPGLTRLPADIGILQWAAII